KIATRRRRRSRTSGSPRGDYSAMVKFTLTHEIDCAVETFWKIFFDRPFNEALFREGLSFPRFEIVEQRESDKEIYRKVSGTPKMDAPAPVAKLLGPGFGYVEEGTFDKATRTWSYKITPSALADKLRNEGVMRVEPAGEGRCR